MTARKRIASRELAGFASRLVLFVAVVALQLLQIAAIPAGAAGTPAAAADPLPAHDHDPHRQGTAHVQPAAVAEAAAPASCALHCDALLCAGCALPLSAPVIQEAQSATVAAWRAVAQRSAPGLAVPPVEPPPMTAQRGV